MTQKMLDHKMANPFTVITKILYGLVFFLVFLFCSPIFVYRLIVLVLAKVFRHDLGSMLSPESSLFLPVTNTGANVAIHFKIRGELDFGTVAKQVIEKCILLRKESTKEFCYPEFQQHYVRWLGYTFRKNEELFSAQDHFHYLLLEKDEDVMPNMTRLLNIPFQSTSSPWEVTFIETKENAHCHHICFKFHHSLGDGPAICKALINAADSEVQLFEKKLETVPLKTKALQICNMFLSYFDVFSKIGQAHAMPWPKTKTSIRQSSQLELIPLSEVKELGQKLKVSVSVVLLTLITGAIRRRLMNDKLNIPKVLRSTLPIYVPSHPNGLSNKVLLLEVALPVGQASVGNRIISLSSQIERERLNNSSTVVHAMIVFLGSIPFIPSPGSQLPVGISIFPGPTTPISICGNTVDEMGYAVNANGYYTFLFNVMSYNKQLRFWITTPENNNLQQNNLEDLSSAITEELKELKEIIYLSNEETV